jgi:hypothetical protein
MPNLWNAKEFLRNRFETNRKLRGIVRNAWLVPAPFVIDRETAPKLFADQRPGSLLAPSGQAAPISFASEPLTEISTEADHD